MIFFLNGIGVGIDHFFLDIFRLGNLLVITQDIFPLIEVQKTQTAVFQRRVSIITNKMLECRLRRIQPRVDSSLTSRYPDLHIQSSFRLASKGPASPPVALADPTKC